MGFWKKLKGFFGGKGQAGGGEGGGGLEEDLKALIFDEMIERRAFSAADLAARLAGGTPGTEMLASVMVLVERLHRERTFEQTGYTRTWFGAPHEKWVYHPPEVNPARLPEYAGVPSRPGTPLPPAPGSPQAAPGPAPRSPAAGTPARPAQPAPPPPQAPPASRLNPFAPPDILALNPEQLRRRAMRITPWRTAWIGRTDVIPPASDERTALIDRGLVIRGFLTDAELGEIHRIGDLWLRHREVETLARTVASRSADEALAEDRRLRAQRKEEKRRLAAERARAHAQAVARRRAEDIIYLGPGVSAGLADRRVHVEKLERNGLPLLATPADLARALGVTISRLRWLCYHSPAAERVHYVSFQVPKRSGGGMRQLSAPQKELGKAQRFILRTLLDRLPIDEHAHGFRKGRSTVTSALEHRGQALVINLDVEDFFPTITFPRVRGLFQDLGYSPAVATCLALLTTEAPRVIADYDGTRYHVAVGDRALPQGACTSPAISNLVCRKLDRRLAGLARHHGFRYTRYADDLTFSSAEPRDAGRGGRRDRSAWLMACVRHVLEAEGFRMNVNKGRVLPRAARQEVTGIVVNHPERLSLPRQEVRRLRALLHRARTEGLAAQNRESRPDFEAWLRGKLAYLAMVKPEQGRAMLAELDALVGRPSATAASST
jgi:hypothetical protein